MNQKNLLSFAADLYGRFACAASSLKTPFLFAVRLFWGIQLVMTGHGKLTHIEKVTGFFTDLQIPFPLFNAYLVGCTEFFCGLFLCLGLLSRLASIPLIISMSVAFLTAERDSLTQFFSDPSKVTEATPFTFLFAALLILIFGPGKWSLDEFLYRRGNHGKETHPLP